MQVYQRQQRVYPGVPLYIDFQQQAANSKRFHLLLNELDKDSVQYSTVTAFKHFKQHLRLLGLLAPSDTGTKRTPLQ
jgi:hypothetical protein